MLRSLSFARTALYIAMVCMLWCMPQVSYSARIKDIATIQGANTLQLVGYGLVTGLSNVGDTRRSTFTIQSITSMLKRFGVTVPQINLQTRNVAAVMVTATVPAFSKPGSKVDIQVSSMGDAQSLQGGVLIMTPLSSADGAVYGMAQGAVSVGGYDVRANGSRSGRNFTTSGRVPNGGILDREVEGSLTQNNEMRIILREPDFTTSTRIATVINNQQNLANTAQAIDAATVAITIPDGATPQQVMAIAAQIEVLTVDADPIARVVINERTGTVVIGANVQLLPAVVAHGGLDIQIQTANSVSQPPPFTIAASPGQGVPIQNSTINVQEEINPAIVLNGATTVQQMAEALNALRVSPRDLIAIFQALKESGSLQAELVIQ